MPMLLPRQASSPHGGVVHLWLFPGVLPLPAFADRWRLLAPHRFPKRSLRPHCPAHMRGPGTKIGPVSCKPSVRRRQALLQHLRDVPPMGFAFPVFLPGSIGQRRQVCRPLAPKEVALFPGPGIPIVLHEGAARPDQLPEYL